MLKHAPISDPALNPLTFALPTYSDNRHSKPIPGVLNKSLAVDEKFRALLIEDNEIVYMVHGCLLTGLGCDVDWAENGIQAFEKASANRYDIILADIGLPDNISGVDVIAAIKTPKHINRDTPIIVLTAHAEEDIKKQCLKLGVKGFYTKPIPVDDFRKIMQKFLSINAES